jgi:hypothetical protein
LKISLSNLSDRYLAEWKLKKNISNFFVKEEIEGEVTYDKDDYKYLIEATTIADEKEIGDLEIECGENLFTRPIVLRHNEGKFNFKNCIATKGINFENKLDCLITNTVNIFDYPASVTQTVQGTIQRDSYGASELIYVGEYTQELFDIYKLDNVLAIVGPYPDKSAEGYQVEYVSVAVFPDFEYETTLINGQIQEYGLYIGHRIELYVQYTRFYSPTSLGTNWIPLTGGGYVLRYEIQNDWTAPQIAKTSQLVGTGPNVGEIRDYGTVSYLKGRYSVFSNTDISNTINLNDVLLDVFGCTGFTLVSNFFNINPDATQPTNPEYDFATSFCHEIKIAQSYDIIREAALEDSFGISGLIDTKDLLTDLCMLFNLVIVTDYDINTIRIEHTSYFSSKGLDLTTKEYEINEVDVNRDTVDAEVFTMAAITPTQGFYQVYVSYTNLDLYKEPNEKRYSTKKFITDMVGTLNNVNFEKDEFKPLFYLLSTESGDVLGLNTPFSMSNLFNVLHQNNRPLKVGYVDGQLTNFGSFSIGMKGQISFLSGVLSWQKLQPYMSVVTRYGTFMIEAIEIDEKNTITLNVIK